MQAPRQYLRVRFKDTLEILEIAVLGHEPSRQSQTGQAILGRPILAISKNYTITQPEIPNPAFDVEAERIW